MEHWLRSGTLQWRSNGSTGVPNHQPYDCFLNRLFRRRSKETSKLRVNGLCAWNSPVTGEFPAQMTSNAENVSIWWRHHEAWQHNLSDIINRFPTFLIWVLFDGQSHYQGVYLHVIWNIGINWKVRLRWYLTMLLEITQYFYPGSGDLPLYCELLGRYKCLLKIPNNNNKTSNVTGVVAQQLSRDHSRRPLFACSGNEVSVSQVCTMCPYNVLSWHYQRKQVQKILQLSCY